MCEKAAIAKQGVIRHVCLIKNDDQKENESISTDSDYCAQTRLQKNL